MVKTMITMQNITFRILLLGLLLGGISSPAWSQEAKDILGRWKDEANPEKKIEMYEQNGRFFGRAIEQSAQEGIQVFQDLLWDAPSKTFRGFIKDPAGSGRFAITISWSGRNAFQFKVKRLVFTKSFRFVRIAQ